MKSKLPLTVVIAMQDDNHQSNVPKTTPEIFTAFSVGFRLGKNSVQFDSVEDAFNRWLEERKGNSNDSTDK